MSTRKVMANAVRAAAGDGNPATVAQVLGMLNAYDHRWSQEPFHIVDVEKDYDIPITAFSREAPPERSLAGKIDAVVEYDGNHYVLEHKTTSFDVTPNSAFWQSINMSGQCTGYSMGLAADGIEVEGVIMDAVKKTAIRPKKIAKKDRDAIEDQLVWLGKEVSQDDVAELRANDWKETPHFFGMRVEQTMLDDIDKYFCREVVVKTPAQTQEYTAEVVSTIQLIEHSRHSQNHIRHLGSCFNFNKPCPFIPLCNRTDHPESENWRKRESVHNELRVGGHNSLTHSRTQCYQTCNRKHHYQYDLQLEKVKESRDDALFIGDLFHQGLEARFKWIRDTRLKEETNESG